jgi:hypothetical protein
VRTDGLEHGLPQPFSVAASLERIDLEAELRRVAGPRAPRRLLQSSPLCAHGHAALLITTTGAPLGASDCRVVFITAHAHAAPFGR